MPRMVVGLAKPSTTKSTANNIDEKSLLAQAEKIFANPDETLLKTGYGVTALVA